MINNALKLYKKHEEIINYLIVGGLTTIVSLASYALFTRIFYVHYAVSNVLSWICAVAFAYFTNKLFVFKSKKGTKKDRTR